MNTATLSPPPRPPRNGNFTGASGEPNGGGTPGRLVGVLRWGRMFLKLLVCILLVIAATQLAFILFQTVRLWFFS
jgi:hypothetical protein